jgi:hypothetical protein
VIKLVHRGLGESTIVQYIGDNGVKRHLDVSDLIRLHEDGVSEPIIKAMQTAKVFDAEADRDRPSPGTPSPGTPSPGTPSPGTTIHPVRSGAQFFKPSRPAVNVEQFGPSILAPQQRSRL